MKKLNSSEKGKTKILAAFFDVKMSLDSYRSCNYKLNCKNRYRNPILKQTKSKGFYPKHI